MKRLAGLSTLAVIISSASGCGWIWGKEGYFRDRGSDYLEARQAAPMRLPPSVQSKRLDPLLPVPTNVADAKAADEYDVPRPQALATSGEISDFSLQKSGESRWLVAQRNPAEVWPSTRQFFESNGFRIAQERPQTGELVTGWQRPEALSASIAGSLKSAAPDSEVRLRVRIEPGVQRNTSEVFVVSASRPAGSGGEPEFPASGPGNAALEAAVLDQMVASMASGAEQGGSVSLLAARDFDAPSRISLSDDGNGNPVLSLGADFDRAWSSVGRALEGGDVRVDDLNRSLGVYYINLAEGAQVNEKKPGFFGRLFGGEPDKEQEDARADRYQVRLTRVGDGVQVSVEKDIDTVAPDDVARRVLGLIQDNLG
jgi:outer membrane protein assembly factor BamC